MAILSSVDLGTGPIDELATFERWLRERRYADRSRELYFGYGY